MRTKCRFAVGERNGYKSSIWTISVNKNDIYIFTRLFGSDFKLSLHETGDSQWSFTSNYVLNHPGMKNNERHFIKWNTSHPTGSDAKCVIRIQIPHSELKNIPCPTKKKVKWISGISLGTYQFDVYITKPTDLNPCEANTKLPYEVLHSFQLNNKSWVVVFYHPVGLTPNDIENARRIVLQQNLIEKNDIRGADWIALFGNCSDGVPFVLELNKDASESYL